jgi:endoglucanase
VQLISLSHPGVDSAHAWGHAERDPLDWTSNNIRFGLDVSRLTGGKHFVINTAENGRGPIHYRLPNGRRINVWCNPGLRGLGIPPTNNTSHPMVDAYLWINRPGFGLGEATGRHEVRALQALLAARARGEALTLRKCR